MKLEPGKCPICDARTTLVVERSEYDESDDSLRSERESCPLGHYFREYDYGHLYVRIGEQNWDWDEEDKKPLKKIERAIQQLRQIEEAKHPERRAFESALHKDPYDSATRLVFADWLDDHDEPEEADRQRQWNREKYDSEVWLRDYADDLHMTSGELLQAARDFLENGDDYCLPFDTPNRVYEDAETFWRHYETVTDGEPGSGRTDIFFRCAC